MEIVNTINAIINDDGIRMVLIAAYVAMNMVSVLTRGKTCVGETVRFLERMMTFYGIIAFYCWKGVYPIIKWVLYLPAAVAILFWIDLAAEINLISSRDRDLIYYSIFMID